MGSLKKKLTKTLRKITPKEIIKHKYTKIVISPGPGNPNQSGNCLKIVKSLHTIVPVSYTHLTQPTKD